MTRRRITEVDDARRIDRDGDSIADGRMLERRDDCIEPPPVGELHAQAHDRALPRCALDDSVSRGAGLNDRDRDRLRPDHPRPVGGLEDVREPEEARDVLVRRVRPELVRRPRLDDPSAAEDRVRSASANASSWSWVT